MQEAFIGEIFLFGGPRSFANPAFVRCEGQSAASQPAGFQHWARRVGRNQVVDLRTLQIKGLAPGYLAAVVEGVYPFK